MPRRIRRIAALLIAALALVACGTDAEEAAPDAFTGADGVVSDVSDRSRVVALSGDLTEILFAIGQGEAVVGVDVTTVHPAEAIGIPIVGVGRFITAEGVLSVDPTLVLADAQSGPASALEQIRAAGVPVVVLPVVTDFPGLYDKISTIGALFGSEDEAATLVDQIESGVEEARTGVDLDQSPRVAFVYTRGPDVVLMFGEGMVSNPVIEAAGAVDAGADSGIEGSVNATAEALVAAAPDVILVPEEGFSILGGIDPMLEIPGVAQTPAGASGRIYAYPEGDILTFGPRVADSIRRLVADLYP